MGFKSAFKGLISISKFKFPVHQKRRSQNLTETRTFEIFVYHDKINRARPEDTTEM